MNKRTKLLLIVGAVVIVVAIAGYFSYKTLVNKETKQTQKQESRDEIANWPTYKSDSFGFSVKYPEGWNVKSSEGDIVFYKRADVDPSSSENSTIKFVKGEFGHGLMGIDREEKKEIDIFGVKGIRKYFYSENVLALVIITFRKEEDFSFEFRPSEIDPDNDLKNFEQFLTQNK